MRVYKVKYLIWSVKSIWVTSIHIKLKPGLALKKIPQNLLWGIVRDPCGAQKPNWSNRTKQFFKLFIDILYNLCFVHVPVILSGYRAHSKEMKVSYECPRPDESIAFFFFTRAQCVLGNHLIKVLCNAVHSVPSGLVKLIRLSSASDWQNITYW